MKSILIKLGKALNVVRRDGIIRGGKRLADFITRYLKMLKKLPPGDILFITHGVGDSALYRTAHVSEELNLKGFKSSSTVTENLYLLDYAEIFKVFIFHKVLQSEKIEKFIKKIKSQNKEIIFETDDLIFDSKYFQDADYFKNINSLEKQQYKKGVGEEILRNPYVKVCTTTTSYLADKLREYNKKVFVVANKLSEKDVEVANVILSESTSRQRVEEPNKEKIRSLDYARDDKAVKLGYFSGTISHNKDFATINEILMEIMEKYPHVELFLVGHLDIENKLNKYKERIVQLPYVPRKKHFENLSKIDINLAPLEVGNPFCESRSENRFIEAGILGVPTIASATRTYREAISDGLDGFIATDTQDWINKLERLILSPELRSKMGGEAYKKILERYTTKSAGNKEYYDYLRQRI